MSDDVTLTKVERLLLSNQLKILKALDPHEADYYETRARALDEGYELHFDELFDYIYDVFPRDKCKWVLQVLQMHRMMWYAWEKYKPEDVPKQDIVFRGFDGNDEGSYYGYVVFFIEGLGRFRELRENVAYGDLNSHSPTLDRYQRMLNEWELSSDKYNLTIDDLKRISSA